MAMKVPVRPMPALQWNAIVLLQIKFYVCLTIERPILKIDQ
jgi:hypothetical protein